MSFKSLNRVQLLGNLGKDPDLRSTPSGMSVCSFSVATTDSYKDKDGAWKDITDWHNVVVWNKLAEIASNSLRKGSKVLVEGRLKTRSYEKDGVTRYITEVVADNIIFLESRSSSDPYSSAASQFDDSWSEPRPSTPSSSAGGFNSDASDEVPF